MSTLLLAWPATVPKPWAKSKVRDEAVSEMPLLPTKERPETVPSAHTQPPSLAGFSLRSQSTPRSASVKRRPGALVLLGSRPMKPLAFSSPSVNTSTTCSPMVTSLVKPRVAEPLRLTPCPRSIWPVKLKLLLLRK